MKEIVQWTKKVSLFLAGIFLVVWGYKVNASNNAKVKQSEKEDDKTEAPAPSIFNTIELRDSTKTNQPEKKEDKKVEKKSPTTSTPATKPQEQSKTTPSSQEKSKKTEPVIESDKKVEESSGTE